MTRDRIYKFAVLISTSSAPEFKVFSQSLPLLALAVYKDRMVGKKKAQDVVKFEAKTVWVFLPPPGSEGIRTNSKETLPRMDSELASSPPLDPVASNFTQETEHVMPSHHGMSTGKWGFQDPTEANAATKENKHRVWGMPHWCGQGVLTVMGTLG